MSDVILSGPELEHWLRHAMTDSGFCARELLGFNYDIDHKTGKRINVGTGGLRDEEPYSTMTRRIRGQDPNHISSLFMLLASRGGLKSSALAGDVVSNLLQDPEQSMLYLSKTDPQVRDKSIAIRRVFETNETIHRCFGIEPTPGSIPRRIRGVPWTRDQWTLGIRERVDTQNPTFKTGSLRRIPTGGHYNRIYIDDLIDHTNCRNPEQLELAKLILKLIMPLRLPGSRVIVAGTPYHPLDLYSYIQSLGGWDVLTIPCGFEIERVNEREFRLTGKPTFPHLTHDYLLEQLGTMEYSDFCAQYLMRHEISGLQVFRREWFAPVKFESWMSTDLTVWIITDVATSNKKGSCMSVVLVVGVDKMRRIYVMDGAAGRMEGGEIIETVFHMHDKWSRKCTMGGVTMEMASATQMLAGFLDQEQRKRGIRLNIRNINRGGSHARKDARISSLEPHARAGNIRICTDTFPSTYVLDGKTRPFYDPTGYLNPDTGQRLPSGDLVEQFVMHPAPDPKHKDLADALADIDQELRGGEKLCYWRPPPASRSTPRQESSRSSGPLDPRASRRFDWIPR